MTYFSKFNQIQYDFTVPGDSLPIIETITDLDRRINIKITKEDLDNMCDTYIVQSGTKPEQLAASLYNNARLHWTIFFINGINDIASDWPMTETDLSNYVTKKYGSGHEYDTHHYEKSPEGVHIDAQFCLNVYGENALLVTNYEHEYKLNEDKRIIKVVKPEYISAFVLNYLGS